MSRLTRLALPAAAAILIAVGGQQILAGPAQGSSSTNISAKYAKPLKAAVKDIGIAKERRSGYKRELFEHWIDADKNGCNTRYEVLIAEAVKKPTVQAGCRLKGGKWKSYYDGKTTRKPSTFDVDHLVPLAEAWDSGASKWNADTRKRFANDLTDARALVAVTAKSNRAKSDSDPSGWMPARGKCRYIGEWVAIKLRWSLTADKAEHATLTKYAKRCPAKTIKVTKAAVKKGKGKGQAAEPTPSAPAQGIKISRIQYDAPGPDDASNTNGEWIELANTGGKKADLTSWYIKDAAGATYTFGKFTLGAGSTVKVHSGKGTPNSGHVYAGWGHVWNNTGDTGTLHTQSGAAAHSCAYKPNSTGLVNCG